MWMGGNYGIVTVDPSNIKFILKTRFKNFPKGDYYREVPLFAGLAAFSMSTITPGRSKADCELRDAFCSHSFRTIQDLVQQKLLELMENLAMSGGCIDLQEVLLRFTFDNICTAAFGVDPGCLALDLPQIAFARAFEEATEFTCFRFVLPPLIWKPMKFLGVGTEKRLQEVVRVVHDFAKKTVADRRIELSKNGTINKQNDLLSRVMAIREHEEDKNKQLFSDEFLKDFCISFILAGRDTSSVALAWFFWLIDKNPDVENKILSEINEVLGHREPNTVLAMEHLKKMVYLQAALSETLRLYPSVPVDFKEVAEDDVLPDGTRVKKGSRVLFLIFSMARMESIWGKDCMEFKPERWIKDGEFVSENQFKWPVFNAGPRLCIGKKFAFMQMKMVAASILMRYEVKVVEGHCVVPKLTTTLYMKNGLLVTFHPRLSLALG